MALTDEEIRQEVAIALRAIPGTFVRDTDVIVGIVNQRLNPLEYQSWYDSDRGVLVVESFIGEIDVDMQSETKFFTDNDLIGGSISIGHTLTNPVDVTVFDASGVKYEPEITLIGQSIVRLDLGEYQPLLGRWSVLIEK